MKCTAPCVPPCEEEATAELLSLTGAHLGWNCEKHLKPLRFVKVGNLDAEYKQRPLPEEAPQVS